MNTQIVLLLLALSIHASDSACSVAPNCATCEGDQLPCQECYNLYGLQPEGTFPVCEECRKFSGCALCKTTKVCEKCSSTSLGPDFNGIATCSPCGRNCKSCMSSGGGNCDECLDSSKPKNNSCECAANCKICKNAGYGACDECEEGYGFTRGHKCEACSSNCKRCYGGRCQECNTGYTVVGDLCKKTDL